eukprot:gene7415-11738_t
MFREGNLKEMNQLLDDKKMELEKEFGKNHIELTLILLQRTQMFYHLGRFSDALKESTEAINILEGEILAKSHHSILSIVDYERLTNFFLQQINKYLSDIKLDKKDEKILRLDETSLPIFKICESKEQVNFIIEEILSRHQNNFTGKFNLARVYLKNGMKSEASEILNKILQNENLDKNSVEYAKVLALESKATDNDELALEAMEIFKEKNQFIELARTIESIATRKKDLDNFLLALKIFEKHDSSRKYWFSCLEKYTFELISLEKQHEAKQNLELFSSSLFSIHKNESEAIAQKQLLTAFYEIQFEDKKTGSIKLEKIKTNDLDLEMQIETAKSAESYEIELSSEEDFVRKNFTANQIDAMIEHFYEPKTENEELAVYSMIHRGLNPSINKQMPFVEKTIKDIKQRLDKKKSTFVLPPSNENETDFEEEIEEEENIEDQFAKFNFGNKKKKEPFSDL